MNWLIEFFIILIDPPVAFIGDGAGVGKGRTIAGLIYENFLQRRKKAIWISISSDLKVDAVRDLTDIGAGTFRWLDWLIDWLVHWLIDWLIDWYCIERLTNLFDLNKFFCWIFSIYFVLFLVWSWFFRSPPDTVSVHRLEKESYAPIAKRDGVMFATYSALIGKTNSTKHRFKSRLAQILSWCGQDFDGKPGPPISHADYSQSSLP